MRRTRKRTKIEKSLDTSIDVDNKDEIDSDVDVSDRDVAKSNEKNLKLYFNSDTQDAIVKFQKETAKRMREDLYVKEILPAFEKLVENLINIHKFTSMHDSYEDLKNDCINFLFETISKFDPSRGTLAFSYFNVVAKNWLITKTKQKSQRLKRSVSLDDPTGLSAHESMIVEEYNFLPPQDELEGERTVESTLNILYDIRSKVKKENELICINSVITIFENIEELDLLNKGAVLLYMRELSGLSPKQLTTTMQVIKKHYKRTRSDARKNAQ